MASKPHLSAPVTAAMKKAGADVLANNPQLPREDLATKIYRAMVAADPGIPELGSRMAQGEVADAMVIDGGGDKRKKREE